ncbi:MAG: glycoside hydrolase family 88 protein [candidate division KSB1 bacterium]|nr:glycoside hydrolase family 88 protein [candidate division KSB1 bacterium]MDZ7358035.1 glycoside hydrolase family 88 protein [candidate division KSB1 bacterium]MDZ7375351.1 glycoside hydrolase family 88 protein [candidate division KSB1 bacterium]
MKKLFQNFYVSAFGSLTVMLLSLSFISQQACISHRATRWSVRMADSEMKRNPEPWMIDFRETPKWEYTQGLVLKAILQVWQATGEEKYFQYVRAYYNQFIDSSGNILTYRLDEYNIDRINPGKPLFLLYEKTRDEKFKRAILLLREQMRTHPRTSEGGFWHKKIYPHQMWLDGIYMASPFLAEFAQKFDEPELLDDVVNQIVLMERHARDENTGLLYHGWDESRLQRWADPVTGRSPNFWGRAMGWYAMALVDVLDFLPDNHPRRAEVLAILNRLASAIAKYQDPKTGVWYQVVDQMGRSGNYLESSASCMFVYALLKGIRNGYLDRSFESNAQRGYNGIIQQFITVDPDGTANIHQVCSVAGLGGSPYRDGSFEYYISEPIRSNDPKAVGPFILASLEYEALRR